MSKLEEDFKRHLQRGRFVSRDDLVVVAVSTGVDSMVLLHLLMQLPTEYRPRLVVAHVNHELRTQSNQEEQFIRRFCRRHGLRLRVAHWPRAQHPATGVEAAARQFRYHFFAATMAATGAGYLLTAHHQNDLAETMLMKLVRGGQLSQLVGIRDQRSFASGQLVRPLLPFPKARLRAYANYHHLTWYEDDTNQDETITRNRYRHELLPALERENPHFLDHLTAYHQQLMDLVSWAHHQADRQLADVTTAGQLVVSRWRQLPVAAQRLVLERWLERSVPDIKQAVIDAAMAALTSRHHPQQELSLPAGYQLVVNYAVAFIQPPRKMLGKPQNEGTTVVELGQWYPINDQQLILTKECRPDNAVYAQEMWLAPEQWPLRLRHWQPGDFIRLRGGGHQQVRRILIDQKVPNQDRAQQYVLVDAQGTVVWVVGRKWSWFDRPTDYRYRWRRVMIAIQEQ